jgi:hypothetical protein
MCRFDLLEFVSQKQLDVFVGKVGFVKGDACGDTRHNASAKFERKVSFRTACELKKKKKQRELVSLVGIG